MMSRPMGQRNQGFFIGILDRYRRPPGIFEFLSRIFDKRVRAFRYGSLNLVYSSFRPGFLDEIMQVFKVFNIRRYWWQFKVSLKPNFLADEQYYRQWNIHAPIPHPAPGLEGLPQRAPGRMPGTPAMAHVLMRRGYIPLPQRVKRGYYRAGSRRVTKPLEIPVKDAGTSSTQSPSSTSTSMGGSSTGIGTIRTAAAGAYRQWNIHAPIHHPAPGLQGLPQRAPGRMPGTPVMAHVLMRRGYIPPPQRGQRGYYRAGGRRETKPLEIPVKDAGTSGTAGTAGTTSPSSTSTSMGGSSTGIGTIRTAADGEIINAPGTIRTKITGSITVGPGRIGILNNKQYYRHQNIHVSTPALQIQQVPWFAGTPGSRTAVGREIPGQPEDIPLVQVQRGHSRAPVQMELAKIEDIESKITRLIQKKEINKEEELTVKTPAPPPQIETFKSHIQGQMHQGHIDDGHMDMDSIADRVYQLLERKIRIERERKGMRTW